MTNKEHLFSLENTDLHTLFTPAWLKESTSIPPSPHPQENFRRSDDRKLKTISGSLPSRNRNNHSSFSTKREHEVRPLAIVALHGWKIEFLPEHRGLDEIAKQIKNESKAYPLFELARIILQKPERYRLRFLKLPAAEKTASLIYQSLVDEGLWLSEKELIAHLLKNYRDRYYFTEKIEVEPPKGSYTSLAVCGMSQTILGPSNHHEYQAKLRQLYSDRFSHLSFEVFKSRIIILRDEVMLEQWRKEESVRETFTPCTQAEGREVIPLSTLAQVEAHFKKEHAPTVSAEIGTEVFLPGTAGMNNSDSVIKNAIEQALQELRRFPLPLSHLLGQELGARGLQVFKADENIVYISVARPRYLSPEKPLSPRLMSLINLIESHRTSPRAEQWQAMVALLPLQAQETTEQRESAIAKDLTWLIHQGYVINYASRGFAIPKKPKPETA